MTDQDIGKIEDKLKDLYKRRSKIDYEIMQLEAYRDILRNKMKSDSGGGTQDSSIVSERIIFAGWFWKNCNWGVFNHGTGKSAEGVCIIELTAQDPSF